MAKRQCDDEKIVSDKNAFEDEADETEESEEEVGIEMSTGTKEADPYSKEGREEMEEDDEAKPGELGFAKGASGSHKEGQTPRKPLSKEKYKPKR